MASYKGHLKGGIVASAAAIFCAFKFHMTPTHITDLFILMGSTLLGSLLPDIDHPQSVLGRRLQIISVPLHRQFGHRSLTHSIFFLLGAFLIPYYFGLDALAWGLSVGIFSHILLDLLCVGSGVAFLYPLYKHRIHLIHTSSFKKRRKKRKKRR